MTDTTRLTCTCGQLAVDVEGPPILSVECCCTSCRAAAAILEQRPGAPKILGAHGTTPFVMYRKDRIRWAAGTADLREHRLSPDAPTRRVVATCCNTPVFLEFAGGHWLSLYAHLWPTAARPPLQLRTMTKDLPPGTSLPTDVPRMPACRLATYCDSRGSVAPISVVGTISASAVATKRRTESSTKWSPTVRHRKPLSAG